LGAIIFTYIPGLAGKILSVDFNIYSGIAAGIGSLVRAGLDTYLEKK
jgi:hypothetical protein